MTRTPSQEQISSDDSYEVLGVPSDTSSVMAREMYWRKVHALRTSGRWGDRDSARELRTLNSALSAVLDDSRSRASDDTGFSLVRRLTGARLNARLLVGYVAVLSITAFVATTLTEPRATFFLLTLGLMLTAFTVRRRRIIRRRTEPWEPDGSAPWPQEAIGSARTIESGESDADSHRSSAQHPVVEFTFSDGSREHRVRLAERPLAIGTSPESDIRMAKGHGAAPDHALIWRHGSDVLLHALGEARCVVNGEPMAWAALDPGDVVEMGEITLRMR